MPAGEDEDGQAESLTGTQQHQPALANGDVGEDPLQTTDPWLGQSGPAGSTRYPGDSSS